MVGNRITRTHTYTRTNTILVPANPFLVCDQCGAPVNYFSHMGDGEGPSPNEPCGHIADYHSTNPGWNPVDGPINDRYPEP